MYVDVEELEGFAAWVQEESGVGDGPVDAFDVVEMLGLTLRREPGVGGRVRGDEIFIGTGTPVRQYHSVIAHECAHELLRRYGLVNDEPNAKYLGAAILVARGALRRQLRSGWDLFGVMEYHVNASAELLARRIVEVRGASLAIYDRGRVRRRIGRAHALERAVVDEAEATGVPVRIDDRTGAWPLCIDGWRRVIVLADPDPDAI